MLLAVDTSQLCSPLVIVSNSVTWYVVVFQTLVWVLFDLIWDGLKNMLQLDFSRDITGSAFLVSSAAHLFLEMM